MFLGLAIPTILMEPCKAQKLNPADASVTGSGGIAENRLDAVRRIGQDFRLHLEKQKTLTAEFERHQKTIQDTESEFTKIRRESLNKQQALMIAAANETAIATLTRSINPDANANAPSHFISGLATTVGNESMQIQIAERLKQIAASQELAQLDSVTQAVVRRRIETMQAVFDVQRQWLELEKQWPQFFARYWPNLDPERKHSLTHNTEVLQLLKQQPPENPFATIASALMLERTKKADDGIRLVDRVIEQPGIHLPAAYATRALLYASLGDRKKSQADLKKAIKADSKSPYVRWMRAQIAADNKEWSTAETEASALTAIPEHEVPARRLLALILSMKPSRSSRSLAKCQKESQLAFDLEPSHNWFSHAALAHTHHIAEQDDEALKQIDLAIKLATEENIEFCHDLKTAIDSKAAFQWDFMRH